MTINNHASNKLDFHDEHVSDETTHELSKSAYNKAIWRLVPFMIVMYMVAFLDRANAGFAKQALLTDLGITGTAFAFGAGVFFLSYAICEVPSNLMMYRVGAKRWMTRIMVTWGLVSACMAFIGGPWSFTALRFCLGIAEAGFFPGVMLYLTFWFPKHIRTKVLGVFYLGFPMAMVIGNPISGMLFDLHGLLGMRGWQWMFLVEGLMAVAMGFATFFVLPDGPKKVSWLSEAESGALQKVLDAEAEQIGGGHGKLLPVLKNPTTVKLIALYAFIQIGSYGVVFFLPEQISRTAHVAQGMYVGLISAVPWLCALVSTIFVPQIAARKGDMRYWIIVCLLGFSAGLVISSSHSLVLCLLGLSLSAACVVTSQSLFWNFPLAMFTGRQAAAVVALINSVGNLGGFIAPNIRAYATVFYATPKAGLYAIAIVSLFSVVLTLMLTRDGHTASSQ